MATKITKKKKKKTKADIGEEIIVRSRYMKEANKRELVFACLGIGTALFSSIVAFYAATTEAKNNYFSVEKDHSFTKLIPLSQPNQSDVAVSNWLTRALTDTFDFSYFNMKSHLNKTTMLYFTDNGRSELLKALENSGNFSAIEQRKLIVSLVTKDTPLVIKKTRPGRRQQFLWKLQVPSILTYRNESKVYSDNLLITVTVARQSLFSSSTGLGIERIVIEKRNNVAPN